MGHSYHHACSSARQFGGIPEDYQEIHDFLDSSKAAMCDVRHRAVLHHAFGVFIAEKVFGVTITISTGAQIPVRLIAEQHIREDCGGIVPTVQDWLRRLPLEHWMQAATRDLPKAAPLEDTTTRPIPERVRTTHTLSGSIPRTAPGPQVDPTSDTTPENSSQP